METQQQTRRSVVFSNQGEEIVGIEQPFMLILKKGEEVWTTLQRFAEKAQLKGAAISGIGALTDVELGYYSKEDKDYQRKVFSGEDELLNINGNISFNEGKHFPHVHVLMGDENYNAFGGHMFAGEIAVTGELLITPLPAMPKRELDPQLGIGLISCQLA